MEKKNMVLLTVIAVATLLVGVVGATFAYFTAAVTNNFAGTGEGRQGNTSLTSANMADSASVVIANVASNAGSFTATNVYPGHKEVALAKVTSKNPTATPAAVKITYQASANGFAANHIKISLYKKAGSSFQAIGTGGNYFQCTKQTRVNPSNANEIQFYETCAKSETTDLGGATLVGSKQSVNGTTAVTLTASDTIQSSATGSDTYYYIVVEFVDTNADQTSADGNKTLTGQVTIELV